MEASDDAFGVLQLSASAVSVAEHYVGPIINVTRVGGIFADVSVKFRAVPLTARVSKWWSQCVRLDPFIWISLEILFEYASHVFDHVLL